MNKLKCRSI